MQQSGFGANLSEASGDHVNGVLVPEAGGGVARKLESILHCINGITVANKAGISAPMVAFRDPFLFPLQASPHHLKKREITPPAPPEFCGHLCMYVHTSPAH